MSRLLTDAELELMNLLWSRGGATARELVSHLPDDRAYTTISTLLRILVDKGFCTTEPAGRAHRYVPAITRSEYQLRKLGAVVSGLFEGSPVDLVRQLVRSETMTDAERAELKQFLDDELEP